MQIVHVAVMMMMMIHLFVVRCAKLCWALSLRDSIEIREAFNVLPWLVNVAINVDEERLTYYYHHLQLGL
jgi:hypothetical protein